MRVSSPQYLKRRPPLARLAVVIPFYNEEEVLPHLKERLDKLSRSLTCAVNYICVNDGSVDGTAHILEEWALAEQNIQVINLARNFGHQVAVTAGLDHVAASSEAVVIMDGDLQDPPEVVHEMIQRYEEGYDIIYGQRTSREGETIFKRLTAYVFYRFMRVAIDKNLPPDTGDFRLMSRRSLDALLQLREKHRFLRGMVTWIGFHQIGVRFERPQREKGTTKYPMKKMVGLAWNAAVSFSPLPLRLSFFFGLSVTCFGILYAGYSTWRHFAMHDTVPGWTALVILLCLIGGTILVSLGIIGEYVAKIYEETKSRPLYLTSGTINLERKQPELSKDEIGSREEYAKPSPAAPRRSINSW